MDDFVQKVIKSRKQESGWVDRYRIEVIDDFLQKGIKNRNQKKVCERS